MCRQLAESRDKSMIPVELWLHERTVSSKDGAHSLRGRPILVRVLANVDLVVSVFAKSMCRVCDCQYYVAKFVVANKRVCLSCLHI